MAIDWKIESQRFDAVAEDYEAYRPGYPADLAKTILERARLSPGSRLLEVGSGTGHATMLFARRGYSILCVEPGPNLAQVAARKFSDDPGMRFVGTRFEDWPVQDESFDLVFSAQAWHWVPKDLGYAKASAALKSSGCLALFWNMYPDPQGPLFTDLEDVYHQRAPSMPSKGFSPEELAHKRADEIAESGFFKDLLVHRFPWSQRYDTRQYLGLLNTYSDHLALPEEVRRSLRAGVAEVIDRHGGFIDRPYLAVLYLAQKA
jgi:SAM-dependent methyltransferase